MNIVVGTKFQARFPVFTGTYPKSRYSHDANIVGVVVRESYGQHRGQHTFTFRVLESDDTATFEPGKEYRKLGRNLYPAVWCVEQPDDYEEQAADKARRAAGRSAKARRERAEELRAMGVEL